MPDFKDPSVSRLRRIAFTMAVAMLATLPVWTSKIYYRDDLYRRLDGNASTWLSNARPATWLIQSLLSFSDSVSDVSPLNLLLGLLALSTASVVFIEKLRLPIEGYWSLIPPLFVILNPFLAQGMLYSYDSLTILLAYAVAMLASLAPGSNRGQRLMFCLLLLLLVLTLYQSGLNVYIACVALLMVCRLNAHRPIWQWLAARIFPLLAAILIYKFAISRPLLNKTDLYSLQHNQLLSPDAETLRVVTASFIRYYDLFISAYPAGAISFVLAPLLLAGLSLCAIAYRLKQQHRLNGGSLMLLFSAALIVIIAVPGLSLALASPVFVPRMLTAWSITLLFCFCVSLYAFPAYRRWLAGLSLVLLLYHLALLLACFNSVINDQHYQFSVMNQIKIELSRSPGVETHKLAFIGQLNDAPEVRTNIRNFPIINAIRMKMMGESEPWIWHALMANSNLSLKVMKATENMREFKPGFYLSRGSDFDVYKVEDVIVIDFRKSHGVVDHDAQ